MNFASLITYIILQPFNALFLLSIAVSGLVAYLSQRERGSAFAFRFALSIVGVAVITFWISLFLSYKQVPVPAYSDGPVSVESYIAGTGGFPLRVMAFPHPPLGDDTMPVAFVPGLLFNYFVWFVIALTCGIFWKQIERYSTFLGAIGVIITLLGFLDLLLMFD